MIARFLIEIKRKGIGLLKKIKKKKAIYKLEDVIYCRHQFYNQIIVAGEYIKGFQINRFNIHHF